jgi:TolB protein
MSIDTSPSWSPNGKQIVFTSDRAGNPHIYIMDSDGSNLNRLTKINPYNDTPIWSPIGDKIALVSRERGETFDIYTLDIMNGKVRQLTAVGNNTHPSWSPDGLHITFSSNRDGQNEIYIMNWDGTGLKRLTYNGGNTSPAWSPRMEWIKGGEKK